MTDNSTSDKGSILPLRYCPTFLLRWLGRIFGPEAVNNHLDDNRRVVKWGRRGTISIDPDDRVKNQ